MTGYTVLGLAWTNAVVQDMKHGGFANAATIAAEMERDAPGHIVLRGAFPVLNISSAGRNLLESTLAQLQKLGFGGRASFCVLIYPASGPWVETSSTALELYNGAGVLLETATLAIACSGSAMVYPDRYFDAERLREAGETGYVLIRDTTCRLFGFHGVDDGAGGFSFDHMFGF